MANRDVILSLSKDPLTSVLSHEGERKIEVLGIHRRGYQSTFEIFELIL
jgi:hypothetical protein